MTYTIEVPADVLQVLAARAQAHGDSVGKYLQDIVIREAAPNGTSAPAAAAPHDAEMDALEELALELAAKYPRTEPLADDADLRRARGCLAVIYLLDANLLLRLRRADTLSPHRCDRSCAPAMCPGHRAAHRPSILLRVLDGRHAPRQR